MDERDRKLYVYFALWTLLGVGSASGVVWNYFQAKALTLRVKALEMAEMRNTERWEDIRHSRDERTLILKTQQDFNLNQQNFNESVRRRLEALEPRR
jgi:hypothetical protein